MSVDNWPDQKTPDVASFLALLRLIDELLLQQIYPAARGVKRKADSSPADQDGHCSEALRIVVHCAGGIGRSAVLIAVDGIVRALLAGADSSHVSPDQAMAHMRPRRANMLQSPEQYVFVHEVLGPALEDARRSAAQLETTRRQEGS